MDLSIEIRLAQNARKNAEVNVQENITVGAVIKSKNGKRYTGSNTDSTWAEKEAIKKAISEGEKDFEYIVIMAGKKEKEEEKYFPSKECINYIKDFVDNDFKIYIIYDNKIERYEIGKIKI